MIFRYDNQWNRFFLKYDITPPDNFCKLFWKCTLFPLLGVLLGLAGVAIVMVVFLGHLQLFLWLFFDTPFPVAYEAFSFLVAAGWIGTALYWLMIGTKTAGKAAGGAIREHEELAFFRFIREAYQAFKGKFCPIVEWN